MLPGFQVFMLPVLKAASHGVITLSDVIEEIANKMNISDEDRKIQTPSGTKLFRDRVTWAKTYMVKAGLLESVGRGQFVATKEGLDLLLNNPGK